ncbi:MAG: radical SAM protein [Deltaproteobacteria bacterium]|nr:radical SAM protein [Deltaproteobacteria bacterium]
MVTLSMTNACNLRCRHCWPDSGSVKSFPPVPTQTLGRLVNEIADLGTEEICLAGGEPLLHPDWYTILEQACGQAGIKRVTLQTNGTLIDDAVVDKLKAVEGARILVQISLDGTGPRTHDMVRGKGSFERSLSGLRHLCESGLGPQTQVAFTEMVHNFADLPLLLELADEMGISRCVSGTLVSQGRAKASDHIAPPTPQQYERLLDLYQTDTVFRSRYERIGNIAALEWFKGRSQGSAQRCVCIETPYIDAQGLVYPCHYMPAPAFAVEGAHERSLESVITKALGLWACLPVLDHRRREELKPCKTCVGKEHCAGGCSGRAYAASGNFTSVEDRCHLRKSVYNWNP